MRTEKEMQQLYDEHEHLIHATIKRRFDKKSFLERHGILKDDLVQHGRMGLIKACKEYDSTSKSTFKTFAINNIFWSIASECKKESLTRDNLWTFKSINRVSFDAQHGEEDDNQLSIHDVIGYEDFNYNKAEDNELMKKLSEHLSPELMEIVKMRMNSYTFEEIANYLGVTCQAIQQRLLYNRGKISLALNLYNR